MSIVSSHAVVLQNNWVTDEYKHMVVETEIKASIVQPGQFFHLTCPATDDNKPFFPRPMSTYKADGNGHVEFLYKVVGKGTIGLSTLHQGDKLKFLGPLGNGFNIKPNYKHILIIGRGVGLATLAPLAESAYANNIHVSAILSAKDEQHIMSHYRFNDIKADIYQALDSDGTSSMQAVEQLILKIHSENPIDCFYTCGSKRITKTLQNIANTHVIDGEVAVEEHMSCGIGMCYGCMKAIKTHPDQPPEAKKVCIDGPVFKLSEVIV